MADEFKNCYINALKDVMSRCLHVLKVRMVDHTSVLKALCYKKKYLQHWLTYLKIEHSEEGSKQSFY